MKSYYFLRARKNINSILRPTVVKNLIFTISTNGLLIVMEKKTGNIVRVTDVFSDIKDKERKRIKPIGFIVGKKIIYLTNSNGKMFLIDIESGKTKKILKVDNDKISRPLFLKNSLYIAKDNSIIKLN